MRSLIMLANLCCHQKENECPPQAPEFTRKITHIKSRKLAVDKMNCKSLVSRSLSPESIFSVNYFSCESPHELNTIDNAIYTLSTPSVRNYRDVSHSVNTKMTYDIQRYSLQAKSENTFQDVPPEGISEIQSLINHEKI